MKASAGKTRGTDEKLPRSTDAVIVALLANPKMKAAAKAAGVSESTLWRLLQDEEFQRKYRAAQNKVFDGSLGSLQGATAAAVDALKKNLTCGVPSAEIMAARTILDFTMKARELLDLSARLEELERVIGARK